MVTQTPPIATEAPQWFKDYATKSAQLQRAVPTKPLRLYSEPTSNLPPASQWEGAIMYDETLGQIVASDGSAWNAL